MMNVCALCGGPSYGPDAICSHHVHAGGADWATGNRIICDFVHRGILLRGPRPSAESSLSGIARDDARSHTVVAASR